MVCHYFSKSKNIYLIYHILVLPGAGPWETGRPCRLFEDLPASVLHSAGRTRPSSHPRQQQEQEQQAEASHDLRLAVSASQNLRGPRLQVQRPPPAGSHHRQVCHSQEDCATGTRTRSLHVCLPSSIYRIVFPQMSSTQSEQTCDFWVMTDQF